MSAEIEPFGGSEWAVMKEQAEVLARSFVVPKAYQGNPNAIIAAALYGREIGLGPVSALNYVHVIEGRPALSAEGMAALVRAQGHAITGKATATEARVAGRRRDSGDEMEVVWDIEMAKRAGLVGKSTWKSYPEAMLWARAVSQLCRMLFPDVLMGLNYTPEEVRDIVAVDEGPALPPCGVDAETGEILQVGPGNLTEPVPAEVERQAEEWTARDLLAALTPSLQRLDLEPHHRERAKFRQELTRLRISWRRTDWSLEDCRRVWEVLKNGGWWVEPRPLPESYGDRPPVERGDEPF